MVLTYEECKNMIPKVQMILTRLPQVGLGNSFELTYNLLNP